MWKKILILLFVFFSTASVIYSIYNIGLEANSDFTRSGGSVYGRIAQAPDGISGDNIGFKKGDKVYMGPLGWLLLSHDPGYTDYISPIDATDVSYGSPLDGWFVLATDTIGSVIPVDSNSAYNKKTSDNYIYVGYENSNIYKKIKELEPQLNQYFLPRDLSENRDILRSTSNITARMIYAEAIAGEKLFIPEMHQTMNIKLSYSKDLTYDDFSFSTNYWAQFNDNTPTMKRPYSWKSFTSTGSKETLTNVVSNKTTAAVRPAAFLDLSKAVFAVSKGADTSGINRITEFNYSGGTIWTATSDKPHLKVRMENENLSASTALNQIENDSNAAISKTVADKTVYLNANAQAGNDGSGGIYTVSALIFNDSGDFLYYKPLEAAKGSGSYALDLTGIPIGKYKIGIVNEAYDENSTAPADSSAITSVLSLEIVKPVSITATPKTGLEVYKNVNQNDIVATYATKDGADPITTTLISDTSVSGHENDYQLFSVSNGNVIVNNPDGLNAGDYYFKLNAIDTNGDPSGGVDSTTVHIVVGKTNSTIAFDDPDQTKKSIAEATTGWNETATANPNGTTKVTYSVSGGDAYLIDIDSDTGAITYNGNGAYGKVKIKATVDDDPSTGLDNYNSAYVEKEIVIYQEVDGHITPDSNSSDSTIPTFTASDPNIKVNGTIGKIIGTKGTPNPIGGTTVKYTYGLKAGEGDANFFSVDSNSGVIKTTANLGVKSYSITVTVSDGWSTKEIPVTINVGVAAAENLKFYENSTSNVAIATKSVKATDTNVTVYATVKGSTNNNPVTYRIKDDSINVIEVNPNSGVVTIHGVGTVTIVAEKKGGVGQADASAELIFTVTAGSQNFIYTDNAGNELPKSGSIYNAYSEVYVPSKTFQLYTAGNPTGTTVTYQLKSGSPTDVISVDSSGLVTILNASLTNQMGKVIVQATSNDPSGNYDDKTIELPINIEKGTRVIGFAENPIYVTNGKGKVTPVTEVDGVTDTDGDVLIEVDSNEDHTIAWTNDNKNIDYNYSGDTGKDIKIHATKPMDRNYKAAEADGILHIMGPDENILAITSPGQIIYGDHFTIRSSQYDADSTNVKYTFEVDSTTYISNPTVNGNSAEFDALQYSGTNKTTITVTRTADGEVPLSKKVQVTVLPKPIEIIIDDKEKLKGEQNPTLTYQGFRSELVSWNGVQDTIQENDIKLNTTANTNSNAGSYPIKGDANSLNKTYPNYNFTFKEGTLTITEENVEDDWYHLEVDDGTNTTYTGNWINKDVNIISNHAEYINLSLDQSTWKPNQVTVTKEGETNQSFWMKKDSGAITKEKQEIIRIDKTAPKVKGIKAKDTNNKLQDIINKLSGGIFFKPGTAFEITTDDTKADLKISGTKEIAYKVYKIDKVSRAGDELIKDGSLSVSSEKANITISETTGTYKVCVIPTDNAGNSNTETCHEVELKKIDVDVDGDGKPDFNDPDGDGCPDLNIKWKDPSDPNKWIVINGDRDYDGIPDLNIDSDGDGIPDLNIDTDDDGKPDLNLVILKKSDWKPTKCVKQDEANGILEEYCTGTTVKATINVDTDGDGIPDINIDTNGDMKADLNITKEGSDEPYLNMILPWHVWEPKTDYKKGTFTYDSIGKHNPIINIDTDGDGLPDINIDLDGDMEPDINIDVDGDFIPDIDIDSTGDGIPDVNVDTDGDGKADENIVKITEWKPNKNIDGDFPYDTMDFSEPEANEPNLNEPNDTNQTTDVQGNYNPASSMGGANTGDTTNLMMYLGMSFVSMGIIFLIIYKKKQEN